MVQISLLYSVSRTSSIIEDGNQSAKTRSPQTPFPRPEQSECFSTASDERTWLLSCCARHVEHIRGLRQRWDTNTLFFGKVLQSPQPLIPHSHSNPLPSTPTSESHSFSRVPAPSSNQTQQSQSVCRLLLRNRLLKAPDRTFPGPFPCTTPAM